jgi:hypothetical protein
MTLSQEILVLDFGDEKNSQFLRSEASSSDFGKGDWPDTPYILTAIAVPQQAHKSSFGV